MLADCLGASADWGLDASADWGLGTLRAGEAGSSETWTPSASGFDHTNILLVSILVIDPQTQIYLRK